MKKYLMNQWRVKYLKTICLLILLNISSASATAQSWQETGFITNSFFEVALGFEHRKAAQKVRKWNKPVKIYVEHQVGDAQLHDELLNAHIKDLRDITKLDIRRVTSKKTGQYSVFFHLTTETA